MKFSNYPITEEVKKGVEGMGFSKPTDIQFKSIPAIIKGEDVLGIAQTGTGKTAAFAIPIVDKVFRSSKINGDSLQLKRLFEQLYLLVFYSFFCA